MRVMSHTSFTFKQFTVYHDRCAMKVGTDGVLLGAWAPVEQASRVLDVGTGTGLIALQMAQRNAIARVTGVEVDADAALQARENVAASPWRERVEVVCADFEDFRPDGVYDLIVSNPPYFVDALKCPDDQRSLARHGGGLNYTCLFRHSRELLAGEGKVSVIVPAEMAGPAEDAAWAYGLYPERRTHVYTKEGKPPRRVLMTFGRKLRSPREDALYISASDGSYTEAYKELTKDFYLKL